jgi:hypothetical protein
MDTCGCWSGNASYFAKTPCRQSLQTFTSGNNIVIRVFSIQYLWETKSMEHASNSSLVAVYTCNKGFYPFNVLFYALHIPIALEDCCTTCVLLGA